MFCCFALASWMPSGMTISEPPGGITGPLLVLVLVLLVVEDVVEWTEIVEEAELEACDEVSKRVVVDVVEVPVWPPVDVLVDCAVSVVGVYDAELSIDENA